MVEVGNGPDRVGLGRTIYKVGQSGHGRLGPFM